MPLIHNPIQARSFYSGDKRAGMESLGVQRPPSGQRNWPRDLNFYIMQRAKSLRQIDRNQGEGPLLRVYEGCACAYLGDVEGAT